MPAPQFAPVAPLPALRTLAKAGVLGNYQLLIAPMVLEHAMEYFHFFTGEHDDQFVILDNGVIELGHSLSAPDLHYAADVVGAHVVVMPDTIDDAEATIQQVEDGLETFRKYDTATDTLGVVQGTTMGECLRCAESLVKAGVDWLAVPRGLTPHLGSRVPLVRQVAQFGLPIHILGFSEDMKDDIETMMSHPLIRGIDAATPIWMKGLLPDEPPRVARFGRRPFDFWQRPPEAMGPEFTRNVETVRAWISHEWHAQIDAQGVHTGVVER
jgi:hypothetical protein